MIKPNLKEFHPRAVSQSDASSDGKVYVADTGNHRTKKHDSSRIYIAKWGRQGSNSRPTNTMGLSRRMSISFSHLNQD